MLFKSKSGAMDGFDWVISNAIAKHIGVKTVEIIPAKYSELPGRLVEGKSDVVVSGYTADPSIPGVDWSDSYLDYGLTLIVRKGSPIKSISDLGGKKIAVFKDPAAEAAVKGMVKGYASLETFEDGYFELLDGGKIDAFIYDYPYAQKELVPFKGRLQMVQFNLTKSTYNVAVPKNSPGLLALVNAAIRNFKESEGYKRAIRKYLGGSGPVPIEKAAAKAAGQGIYAVKPGDSLSGIATSQLGNYKRWPEIWDVNRQRIADPNLIQPGWELLMPGQAAK
jgi:ABC-type amino acid transport substrate-binding protein